MGYKYNEREIENLFDKQLLNNGWVVGFQNINRNVYYQKARTKEENDKLEEQRPDFCLYIDKTSSFPEIVVETKKPNMNLAKTKKQALTYAKLLGSKIIILFDGLQTKSYWVENEEELLKNGLEVDGLKSKEFYIQFIATNTNHHQDANISINSKEELIAVFVFANQKLRKAGITKGMERFFEFSNLLFLKLISEDNDIVSKIIPPHIKWESYKIKVELNC